MKEELKFTRNLDLQLKPIHFPWKRPCPQKILIVTDGYPGSFLNGSFSKYYFGLSAVIDTLLDQTEYYVKFNLTLAHRQTDDHKPNVPVSDPAYQRYGPNFEGFRFTTAANDIKTGKAFDINYYDQIWLFGVRANVNDVFKLDDDELVILTEWMKKGGGLFATGDHDDLGASLCARVPRASKMRMWTTIFNNNGQVVKSPPVPNGVNRHDTLKSGHDNTYTFDDESDDIPMDISPKFYYRWSWHPFYRTKFPHPILCGKDGVIDILPDHPHEGEVIEENQVNISETLVNGEKEFPKIGSLNFRPEVIAHAHVLGDHTAMSDINKGAANSKTFGAIGAYDGYQTNLGRVVVDSTWHHWFDVNLIGRPVGYLNTPPFDSTNPKTLGFLGSPSGLIAYKRIQNYFINVGLWLAPKSDRLCMLNGLLWGYVVKYPAVERFSPKMPIIELGTYAKDALGKIAGQCNLRSWIFEVYPAEIIKTFDYFNGKGPHQCLTCPPEDLLEIYALGAITRNLLELAYEIQDESSENLKMQEKVGAEVNKRILSGLEDGFKQMITDMDASMTNSRRVLRGALKTDVASSIKKRFG